MKYLTYEIHLENRSVKMPQYHNDYVIMEQNFYVVYNKKGKKLQEFRYEKWAKEYIRFIRRKKKRNGKN